MSEAFFDRIFGDLVWRKAYHVVIGCLVAAVLIILPVQWYLLGGLLYLLIFWRFGRRISFAAVGILLLLVLTWSKPTTLGAILVLTVGDGAAALAGSAFGRRKWPWNRNKSVVGSAAFFLSAFLALLLILPAVLPATPRLWLLAGLPALVGAAVETVPVAFLADRKADDNLTVILASGAVLHGLIWLG